MKYDPKAEDGFDFWCRETYGDTPTDRERAERTAIVKALIKAYHGVIADCAPFSMQLEYPLAMCVNQACEDILNAIATQLWVDSEAARYLAWRKEDEQPNVEYFVQCARMPENYR